MAFRRLVWIVLGLVVVAFVLAAPTPAQAQGRQLELVAGLAILHSGETGVGAEAEITAPLRSITTPDRTVRLLGGAMLFPSFNGQFAAAFGGGIEVRLKRHKTIHPIIRVIAGIVHTGIASDEKNDPDAKGRNAFGLMFGGGCRIVLSPRLDALVVLDLAGMKLHDRIGKGIKVTAGIVVPIGRQ